MKLMVTMFYLYNLPMKQNRYSTNAIIIITCKDFATYYLPTKLEPFQILNGTF